MLIVRAKNIFTDTENLADYEVHVLVNDKPIYNGYVIKHDRAKGWRELLRRIAASEEER